MPPEERTETSGRVDALEDTLAAETTSGPGRVVPEHLGRYEVGGLLGEGGMGSVYRGRDPELDRPVAIKVIAGHGRRGDLFRKRLAREAQALAALSHPNVVNVFEVGAHGRGVFIAMELVVGETLDVWTAKHGNGWRQTLQMYVQAGRGLAAAHAKGIVHRDFKPSNVLVGDDGRPRVLDFGLATEDPSASGSGSGSGSGILAGAASSGTGPSGAGILGGSEPRLTEAGAFIGTPAYMAPEHIGRGAITAATDQFSFCVALWEALVGARPFPGDSVLSIVESLSGGVRSPVAPGCPVPRRVLRVLDRGLQVDPRRRFATMTDLLARLQVAAVARRRRVVVGTVLVVGGAAATLATVAGPAGVPCDAASLGVDPWTDADRARLRAAVDASEDRGIAGGWPTLEAALNSYRARWVAGFETVCTGGVEAAGDARTFDLRIGCFRQRAASMHAVVDELSSGDAKQLASAAKAVAGVASIDECPLAVAGDPATDLPEAPVTAASVTAMRAELSRVRALLAAGRNEEAALRASAVVDDGRALDFAPVVVEAQQLLGTADSRRSRGAEAEQRLTGAFWSAVDIGHDAVAARAASELAWLVGYLDGRHAEGVAWARHYEAAALRAGQETQPNLDALLGPIQYAAGNYEQAFVHLERNLALQLDKDPNSRAAAIVRLNLGVLYADSGQAELADHHLERAGETLREAFPDGHPDLALIDLNRAKLRFESRGDLTTALALATRGLTMSRSVHGEVHATTGLGWLRLARLQREAGQTEDAFESLRQAELAHANSSTAERLEVDVVRAATLEAIGRHDESVARWQHIANHGSDVLGAEHPMVNNAKHQLGKVAAARGEVERAERLYRESLAGAGTDRTSAGARYSLAALLLRRGALGEARDLVDRHYAGVRASLGPEHPATLRAAVERAKVMAAAGDTETAQRALIVVAKHPKATRGKARAAAEFALAQSLHADEPDRARRYADVALAHYREPPRDERAAQRVQAWRAAVDAAAP